MAKVFESLDLTGMRKTHLRQLLGYVLRAEEEGTYSGNKEQFWKRHKEIRDWLRDAVNYAYEPGIVLPRKKGQ